jgi:hypothetical protein
MAYASNNGYVFDNRPIFRGGIIAKTITADFDMDEKSETYQIITNNKGSSATIKLPAEKEGSMYWLKNDSSSAHAFVIQTDGGSPVIGGAGLAAGKAALVVCDGTNWHIVFQQA